MLIPVSVTGYELQDMKSTFLIYFPAVQRIMCAYMTYVDMCILFGHPCPALNTEKAVIKGTLVALDRGKFH